MLYNETIIKTSTVQSVFNKRRKDSSMSDWNNNDLQFNPSQYRKDALLQRPGLQTLLEEATKKHVVTVVAGPGYGKSTAVSSFLLDKKQRTAWLTLTQLDNFDTRLWESLFDALRPIHQRAGDFSTSFNFPASDFAFDNLAKLIIKKLDSSKRYYLVLDDYHKITNPTVHQFVERFILMPISNLCIIIISRKEPLIDTGSLLAKNLLFQINDESLRLTEDELSSYFSQQGILLMEQAKSEFYQYTGGWFFSTHLVCLSLKKGILYKTNPLNAVKLDIFSLLESEIFSVLSKELRCLLLRLSLLKQPPLELAVQLADGQLDLVNQIMSISSFITYDSFTNTVFIHQLFLDFLRKKHHHLPPSSKQEIFLMAAQWYEKNEYRIDAITYYEKIKCYDQVITILKSFTAALPTKTVDFLLGVIDRMPGELLIEKPIVRFLYIKFLMNNYRMDEVKELSLALRQELEGLPPTPEITAVLGELYTHLGFQTLITSGISRTYEFANYFEMAHKCLPEGSKLIHKPYVSRGNYICNVNSHEAGEIDNLILAIKHMLPFGTKVVPNTFDGYASLAEAELAYFRKDTKAAENHITQAILESQEGHSDYMETIALFLQARIYTDTGNYPKVISTLEQQKNLVERANRHESTAMYDIALGWFFAQLGNNDMVPHWIKDEQQSWEVMTPVAFAADKLVRAKCLLNDNSIYELLALLNSKPVGFTFEYYIFGSIEMKVLKAIALSLIKEYKEAAKVLQEAYELALPNRIIMPFIENGKYTRTLIKRTAPYIKIPSDWLENIQAKSTTYAKRLSNFATLSNTSSMPETKTPNLSRRESEILMSLCQNLTRDEIAHTYGLSINTVKSVISSIHGKLGVNNNMDAVRVATQLNLL